jgi:hypothetical protein
MNRYEFDVKLFANIVIESETLGEAVAVMEHCLSYLELPPNDRDRANKVYANAGEEVRIVSCSVSEDGETENRNPSYVEEDV